jgi:phosphatidylserine/phosphatidylglycerophosphate/cardiolipin synthase-like enzyme
MNEKEFRKLLIDTVRYGNQADKDKILELLKITELRFEKTGQFTRHLWNHYQEFLSLHIIPQKMGELQKYLDYITKTCYDIYEPNGEFELWDVSIKPGKMPTDEDISQDIHFEHIQRQIIEEIRNAKYIIWVAVAWFTDPVLYKELVKKKSEGVNVQIVIDDNDTNSKAPFRLENDFETYKVSIQSLYKNIMHHKFCIIDLKTSIHGSYNWTNAAQYNKETISIDRNRETTEKFADEFKCLKRNQPVELSL